MELGTIESRFALMVAEKLQRTEPSPEIAELVASHPHLWPFFLFPGEDTFGPPLGYDSGQAVHARAYRGRWITDCPFCTSAQDASSEDRWFFCASCKNGGAGNRSIAIAWPVDRADIEAILLRRPFMDTRNWSSAETLDELVAENEAFLGAV